MRISKRNIVIGSLYDYRIMWSFILLFFLPDIRRLKLFYELWIIQEDEDEWILLSQSNIPFSNHDFYSQYQIVNATFMKNGSIIYWIIQMRVTIVIMTIYTKREILVIVMSNLMLTSNRSRLWIWYFFTLWRDESIWYVEFPNFPVSSGTDPVCNMDWKKGDKRWVLLVMSWKI